MAPFAGAMSEGGCAPHVFGPMVVVTLELSLKAVGSKLDPEINAVLVTEPEAAVTVYEAVIVTLWPAVSVPSEQGKPVMQGEVATVNERPAGVGSLRTTFVAGAGPLLVTVIV